MASTARAAVVTAINTILAARQTASPTLLRRVYAARPGSYPETPCAYLAARSEDITYTAQTRARTFVGLEVVVVDVLADNLETAARMDVLVDLLVDDFWQAGFYSGGGQLQLGSVNDLDIVLGTDPPVTYRAAVLGFGNPANPTFVREGGP